MIPSFIIPTFNASSTIIRCLESIYALDWKSDFEVIVVDDCSTDNTVAIIEDYASHYVNLSLIRQMENHRQGAARNRGLNMAKGDFVVFVDSDDEVCDGILKALKMADNNGLDMVAMRSVTMSMDGKVKFERILPYSETTEFCGIELQTRFRTWATVVWAYIFKKTFLDEVKYPFAEDVLYEDADFVYVHLFHAKRMSYCDECAYIMNFNIKSVTHTISYVHLSDYALLGTRMLKFYLGLEDKSTQYSESIFQSVPYHIRYAFGKLYRLGNMKEIQSFYDRFDAHYDRSLLLEMHLPPTFHWPFWIRFCLRHSKCCVLFFGILSPVMVLFRKLKSLLVNKWFCQYNQGLQYENTRIIQGIHLVGEHHP